MTEKPKIWGIGPGRTATRSLCKALEGLGYEPIHNPISLRAAEDADSAVEGACLYGYRYLYHRYPNSKFILTTRDLFTWIESCHRAFEKWPLKRLEAEPEYYAAAIRNRLARFGCTSFDRKVLTEHYFRHQAEITTFFADKPESLLVVDLTRSHSWDPICSFLEIQTPSIDFPHEY